MTDSSGNVWTVLNAAAYENGNYVAPSGNVTMLMYYNGAIYQQNTTCGAYEYEAAQAGFVTVTSFPSDAEQYVPPLVAAACPGTGGVWQATPQAGMTALMISDPSGSFYYETITSGCTEVYSGTFHTTPVSTSATAIPAQLTLTGSDGYLDPSDPVACGTNGDFDHFTGTVVPGISVQTTSTGTISGTAFTINWTPLSNAFNQLSNLSDLAGSYVLPDGTILTIDSQGNMYEPPVNGAQCNEEGSITLENPLYSGSSNGAYNVYMFSMGPYCGPTTNPGSAGFTNGILTLMGSKLIMGDQFNTDPTENSFIMATKQ